jgi:tetratricopeptide (TPR) repeat protein
MRGHSKAAFAVGLLFWGNTSIADQDDPRLTEAFVDLARSTVRSEAAHIEQRIWGIWLESGDPDIDLVLHEGMAAMDAGDGARAMAAFDRVVETRPGFAEGWNKRATLSYLMGRYAESIADIDRTLALEPRHFGALSGLALIRERQRDPFAALEALEKVARIHPLMPNLTDWIQRLSSELGVTL